MQILKKKSSSDNFGSTKEKRDQTIISMVCSGDRSVNEHEVNTVLEKIYEFGVGPLEVGQPVKILALHPKVGGLHTGSVLTSNMDSAHIQFDREDLGAWLVKDINMIPFLSTSLPQSDHIKPNDIRNLQLAPNLKSLLSEDALPAIPIENTSVSSLSP